MVARKGDEEKSAGKMVSEGDHKVKEVLAEA